MKFELIKSLENCSYYGYIPDTFMVKDSDVERFLLGDSDIDLLESDFVDEINVVCETMLDRGDIDFFDKEKCIILKTWLEKRLCKDVDEKLALLYTVLLNYTKSAIELNTGVVIEL